MNSLVRWEVILEGRLEGLAQKGAGDGTFDRLGCLGSETALKTSQGLISADDTRGMAREGTGVVTL